MRTASSGPATEPAVRACAPLKLSPAARELLHDRQRLVEFQALLVEKELFADAVRVTAACLVPRDAVWWGALCLWSLSRPEPPPEVWAVLQAVLTWLREPSDAHRRAAEAAGRAAGPNTPAGTLGLAVFLSEGSLSLPGLPCVAPEPHLTPCTVAAALLQASRKQGPDQAAACQAQFLAIAHEVAQGNLTVERTAARLS